MRKFWTVALRVVLVTSFLGIVLFSAVAIFTNTAYTSNAYNTTTFRQQTTPYTDFYNNIENRLYSSVDETSNPYGSFLNEMMSELNSAIDYYTNYLVVYDKYSKDTNISLKASYDKYANAFSVAKTTYEDYIFWFNDRKSDHEEGSLHYWTVFERNKFATLMESVLSSYLNAFNAGVDFFWNLFYSVKNNYFCGDLNYEQLAVAIRVSYTSFGTKGVFSEPRVLPSSCTEAKRSARVRNYLDIYTESQVFTNNQLNTFVGDLNKIDISRLVNDYNNYYVSASQEIKISIVRANNFINANF